MGLPPSPLALREAGRFLAPLGMTWGFPLAPLRSAKGEVPRSARNDMKGARE